MVKILRVLLKDKNIVIFIMDLIDIVEYVCKIYNFLFIFVVVLGRLLIVIFMMGVMLKGENYFVLV